MYIADITRTLIRGLLQDDKIQVTLVPTGWVECPKAGIKEGRYSYFYIALHRHNKDIYIIVLLIHLHFDFTLHADIIPHVICPG